MQLPARLAGQYIRERARTSTWREHGEALALYMVLCVALSWPLIRDFSTRQIGFGIADPRHSIWIIWNVQQWVLGKQPLFYAPTLYYPYGTPLLMDGVGPISGLFALPFWGWGRIAAYNGAILVGLWLSGYCMYLLARSLGFERGVALFAGIVLQVSPIHLAGVIGHIEKTFVGFLPLTLLCLLHALDPKRRWWWAAATGLVLLLTALYSGYQFIFAVFGVSFFVIAALLGAAPIKRWFVLRRSIIVALSTLVLAGPYLAAIIITSNNPLFKTHVNVARSSPFYSPDLLQFFFPSFYHISAPIAYIFNGDTINSMRSRIGGLTRSNSWYGIFLETSVTISLTGLILSCIAAKYRMKQSRQWLIFTLLIVVIALGPSLRAFGITGFTIYHYPIILPYALLSSLPGLDFMRAPGRWMMLGAVGIGILAGKGLIWLRNRWPAQRHLITIGAILLLLLESWPRPWIQADIPPTPPFYRQIAGDGEMYGVLDLPAGTPEYISTYQMYQMTHHKGIAWGYLSHTYTKHPLPILQHLVSFGLTAPDVQLNGRPAPPFANAQADLARAGYRYVVWHKTLRYEPAPAKAQQFTGAFIKAVFGAKAIPFYEDAMVRVYRVVPPASAADLKPTIRLDTNWYVAQPPSRWATSPATLHVDLPCPQAGTLRITPSAIHAPDTAHGLGATGVLTVQAGSGSTTSVPLTVNQTAAIPLALPAGSQTITLSLQAGNFRPSQYGSTDNSIRSFAISALNLELPKAANGC